MKTFLIHMIVLLHKNYLNLIQNEMDIVYIPETKYKLRKVKKDRYSAIFCFDINYLTKVKGLDFKSAVSNLYYQMI